MQSSMDITRERIGVRNWDNIKLAVIAVQHCGISGRNLRGDVDDPEYYEENHGEFINLVELIKTIKFIGTDAGSDIDLDDKVFSSEIQDFIAELYVSIIRSEIVKRVNSSKYYSICTMRFDSQNGVGMLVLFVRYLRRCEDGGNFCVQQDFLGFLKDEYKRDEKYVDQIKKAIDGYGLDLQKMRGYVHDYSDERLTDGVIDSIYPQALCTGNYTKSENTTLMHLMFSSRTFNLHAFMMYDYLSDVGKYIWTKSGGSDTFLEKLQSSPLLQIGKRLVKKSAKENQNFFSDVRKVLSPIISTVRQLDEDEADPTGRMNEDWDDSDEPGITSRKIQSFEFIAMAFIFDSVVAHVTKISKDLHKPNIDLVVLMEKVDVAINELVKARKESESNFHAIFDSICNFCDQHSIKKDLDTSMMSSYDYEVIDVSNSDVLKKYVREYAYESLLDGVIDQLKIRFNKRYRQAVLCQRLIPSFIGGTDNETNYRYCQLLESALMLYEKDTEMKAKALKEIKKWRLHWLKIPLDERPKNVIQTLCWIKEDKSFTNVKTLLEIFVILPMANVSRVVSQITKVRKHFKCAWRCLSNDGLGLLFFHPDITVDTDRVIQSVVDSGKLDFE